MYILFSLLVSILGCIIFAVFNGKASEIGKIMFWTGLLVFLLYFSNQHINFFSK